ncbi:Aste57867_3525 [Aphanomyces stellatus]|uniref:Aste57867_3525 protein n=1 Tax=Aphanomyces stellatus TaxID=120398 RepID=A0A485KAQ3_9STRA|nr:hypothetical protein As57867_003514 [Aphanomyces stellatus]VFT80688.1 Aste57867_3525 [Aphanomyces stellatus]
MAQGTLKTTTYEEGQPVRAIVIGAGQRGRIYAQYAEERPDLFQSTRGGGRAADVLAGTHDQDVRHLALTQSPYGMTHARHPSRYSIAPEHVFVDWKDAAAVPKFADAVIIATQDAMHADPAVAFADLGYHILLEKPMAPTKAECIRIFDATQRNNVMLSVCHVMRCSPYSRKLRELTGLVGKVVNVQHLEPVGFWHQAHSFVRGNWRREDEATFMLMAKSCHDIDYIHFLMQKEPRAVSSFGSLVHFRKEDKPEGAADRCLDCPVEASCAYSAKRMYLNDCNVDIPDVEDLGDGVVRKKSTGGWYNGKVAPSTGYKAWPLEVLHENPTVETITEALRTGPYGRCVYECDNDVVDNQVVNFQYQDGSTASFTMIAYTESQCMRKTKIFGTHGELTSDGTTITHFDFLSRVVTEYTPSKINAASKLKGHDGADFFLVENFVHGVRTNDPDVLMTGAAESLKSHLMVFAAEEARLTDSVVHL